MGPEISQASRTLLECSGATAAELKSQLIGALCSRRNYLLFSSQ
jgi:hypothetical protein